MDPQRYIPVTLFAVPGNTVAITTSDLLLAVTSIQTKLLEIRNHPAVT